MKTKFNEFLNESLYTSLKANLYSFFENSGLDVNIVQEDNQTMVIELPFNVTKKENWWNIMVRLCETNDYDNIFVKENKICLSRNLGIIRRSDAYINFSD